MHIVPANISLSLAQGQSWVPRMVLLFSGHMIDAAERQLPRFPPEKVAAASRQINLTLQELGAGEQDLALTQGACGGDILFAEACLLKSVPLQLLQPFSEAEFIQHSVLTGGRVWLERYQALTEKLAFPILAAPQELGPLPDSMNAYERCNLWLLASAQQFGATKVRFICLWNGGNGDGPGGTVHMLEEVRKHQGRVLWIDTRQL